MNQFGLTFHHLGLAVREPSRGCAFLLGLGYRIEASVLDSVQKVNLAMARHDRMPDVEIIWSDQSAGPLDRMLDKYAEGIIYHVCYVTQDITASLQAITDAGLKPFCVSSPRGAVLFGGRRVSFYMVQGMGLIEIIEDVLSEPSADSDVVEHHFS